MKLTPFHLFVVLFVTPNNESSNLSAEQAGFLMEDLKKIGEYLKESSLLSIAS